MYDIIVLAAGVMTVVVCIALAIGEHWDNHDKDDWLDGKKF